MFEKEFTKELTSFMEETEIKTPKEPTKKQWELMKDHTKLCTGLGGILIVISLIIWLVCLD